MKKIVPIIFSLIFLIGQFLHAQNSSNVTHMKIDQSLLSESEKKFIYKTDSIASVINNNSSIYIRNLDTTGIANNMKTAIKYQFFYDSTKKEIIKITSSALNSTQDLKYTFYYVKEKIIKIDAEINDYPPFTCSVYYFDGKPIYPKELSFKSAEASMKLSIQLLELFKVKYYDK
jgi:hypothetical protein